MNNKEQRAWARNELDKIRVIYKEGVCVCVHETETVKLVFFNLSVISAVKSVVLIPYNFISRGHLF